MVLAKNVTGTNGGNELNGTKKADKIRGSVVQTISTVGKPLMNSTAAVAKTRCRQNAAATIKWWSQYDDLFGGRGNDTIKTMTVSGLHQLWRRRQRHGLR